MEYTKEQKKAIETNDKNLRIIACAGSGKTTTVAEKIAYLLDKKNKLGVSPENIIAFTYTEKAAAELKDKVLSAKWHGRHVHRNYSWLVFKRFTKYGI